jgi:phosphohistidine phosphatase
VKTLLILRQAKAHPDSPLGDWSRDLAERGRRNAPVMGDLIRERIGRPDAIVSSDAHRARQTAELAAKAIGFDAPIVFDHAVYDAGVGDLVEVVQSLPEGTGAALLVGHNPGLEALVAFLAGSEIRLPTAGLAHLALDIEQWADTGARSGRLLASYTPKELGT